MSRMGALLVIASLALPVAAVAQEQSSTTTRTQTTVIRTAPPAPMNEAVPTDSPYAGAVWIPGHFEWTGDTYTWRHGHWDRPPASMHVWVPGHWDNVGGSWVWTEGHWSAS